MNVICCICHENARVPVRFICFPCKNEPGQPSCNSISRVCLLCAREYLQLNKQRDDRVASRKCLTCPAMVRCSQLSAVHSYEKDFFIMSHDSKDDYPCFYEKEGCVFHGTQNQLDHHIQTECSYRIISCRYCYLYYQACEATDHVEKCVHYFQCSQCQHHIPVPQEMEHFLTHHQQRPCVYCRSYVHTDIYEQHLGACPERPHECPHCHQTITKHAMYDHLMEHILSCEDRVRHHTHTIHILSTQIFKLVKEVHKYR